MSLQIGRITGLPEPKSWTSTGETAIITGYYSNTADLGAVANMRDRLLGYDRNIDEPSAPIIVDSEPRLSGFYRIDQVSVPSTPATIARGFFEFQLAVTRVSGFHAPMFEDILTAANRIHQSSRPGYGFVGIPQTAREFLQLNYTPHVQFDRALFPSPDIITVHLVYFSAPPWTSSLRFAVPVADYYKGRCQIQTYDSALREIVGRQLFAPDMTNWVISNGLVKVEASGSGADFQVTNADSAGAWGVTKSFRLRSIGGAADWDTRTSLMVLRNAPEECILRIAGYMSSIPQVGTLYLDIRLRRGQRTAEFVLTAPLAQWKLSMIPPVFAMSYTSLGSTMVKTTNDTSGNRLVVSMANVSTYDLVNTTVTTTGTTTSVSFAIGAEVPGGNIGTYETSQDMADQYCAVVGERVQVVGR